MSLVYWLLGLDDAGSVSAVPEWSWQVGSPLETAVLVVVGLLALVATLIPATAPNALADSNHSWRCESRWFRCAAGDAQSARSAHDD